MRPIDADALFKEFENAAWYNNADRDDVAEELLLDAPTVTFQKWFSVKERLPELIPCNAGTAYSEAVVLLTKRRTVVTAVWTGTSWIGDFEFWEAEDDEITHWMSVTPLPEPPKEEEDAENDNASDNR